MTKYFGNQNLEQIGSVGSSGDRVTKVWSDDVDGTSGSFATLNATGAQSVKVNDIGLSDLVFTPAFLTGNSPAMTNIDTWNNVADGEFEITLDGTTYQVTGIDFTGLVVGVDDMYDVASIIQTALRAETSTLATVTWVPATSVFVVTSANTTYISEVSNIGNPGLAGTPIHNASYMNCGGGSVETARYNGTYSVTTSDFILSVSANATDITYILIPSAQCVSGRYIVIKDAAGNAAAVNILISGDGKTIDGDATKTFNVDNSSINLYSDGVAWFVW